MALGELIGSILYKLNADTSGYVRGFERAQQSSEKWGKATQETAKASEEAVGGVEKKINSVADAFQRGSGAAKAWADGVGDSLTRGSMNLQGMLKGIDTALGATEVAFRGFRDVAQGLGIDLPPVVTHMQNLAGGVADLAKALANIPNDKLKELVAGLMGGGGGGKRGRFGGALGGIGRDIGDLGDFARPNEAEIDAMFNGTPDDRVGRVLNPYLDAIDYARRDDSSESVRGTGDGYDDSWRMRELERLAAARRRRDARRSGGGGGGFRLNAATAPGIESLDWMPTQGFEDLELDDYSFGRAISVDQYGRRSFSSGLGGGAAGTPGAIGSIYGLSAGAEFGSVLGDELLGPVKELAALQQQQKESILASVFGKPEEISMYAEQLSLLSDTLGVLGGVLQQTYDAWASGEKSLGEAFADGARAAAKGLGSMMAGKAIQHGAEAVGELAWAWASPLPHRKAEHLAAAAFHGKAALAFGLGAAAMGVASRAAGGGEGGGASTGGGYGSSSGGSSFGNRGSDRGSHVTVYVGDYFAEGDSPAEKRSRLARTIRRAQRDGSDSGGVEFR